jgi:endoglucanase
MLTFMRSVVLLPNCARAIRSLAALTALLALYGTPASGEATAEVRVNQLGYELGATSRAYLMSDQSVSGAVFKVVELDGETIFSAPVGAMLGKWGRFKVYALDFPSTEIGQFQILVNGPAPATSPKFRIANPSTLYSQGIANALYFYQNERDGADFVKSPLRTAAGHLNDASASVYNSPQFDSNDLILGNLSPTGVTVDASGGWWDAGDYLKFVETHSYTVALMIIGARDFPQQMGLSAGASNVMPEAKFGLDWLQKMWDDQNQTLYYQVGIGTDFKDDPNTLSDHDLWRLPQSDDTMGGTDPNLRYVRHRPVFSAGPAGSMISPNLAGRLAADFAVCYQVFQETDPAYANQCLASAEHIFDLANTSPTGNLLTTAPFDFYGETEWRDDLELGAAELYFALQSADGDLPPGLPHSDPQFYLQAAAHWAHAYITGPNDAADTLNLYDVSGLAHFELYRAISVAGNPPGLEVSPADLLADLKKELDNALAQGNSDAFGFGFPWNVYDTATHGAGLSVEAKEYAFLTGSSTYDNYSQRWAANILGANAWGASFIVGDGETFPDCMQHQVANIVGSLNGNPPLLRGALVEGPNSFAATGFLTGMRVCPQDRDDDYAPFDARGAVFKDNQQAFSNVEPAIDLTAPSFLMFAWRISGQPSARFQK